MTVDPEKFSKAMSERWVADLGNALTDNLCAAWAQMAHIFNTHITGEADTITAFPLPTGAGKTQGLAMYCSMLCQSDQCSGVLIVTSFIDEANEIADCINQLAQRTVAIAEHGKSNNSPKTIEDAPILVITHSAYQRTMDAEFGGASYRSKWKKYSCWSGGTRKLTVIDEAIDIVEHSEVTLEQLRLLKSLIPTGTPKGCKDELEAVNAVYDYLKGLALGEVTLEEYELIRFDQFKEISGFSGLREAVALHIGKHLNYEIYDIKLQDGLKAFARKMFDDLERVVSSWSLYIKNGLYHTLRTSRFVLPLEINRFVVLDATAPANPVTRALEGYLDIAELSKIKSYRNLNLHISVGHGVSKFALEKLNRKDWGVILDRLSCKELKDKENVLLCVPKFVEDRLGKRALPAHWSVMHWGAINGRNDWKHCDAVVVYGLPYLSHYDCASNLMAFLDWKYTAKKKFYDTDILRLDRNAFRQGYLWRHIIVSLVQAINRAHCRKMIDGGNCPQTDVYLFVKSQVHKDRLCHHLSGLMPDIIIQDWLGPKVEADVLGLNKTEQKIVDALKRHGEEVYEVSHMLKELEIIPETFSNNYPPELSKGEGKLYAALQEIGWRYVTAREARDKLGMKYRQHFVKVASIG